VGYTNLVVVQQKYWIYTVLQCYTVREVNPGSHRTYIDSTSCKDIYERHKETKAIPYIWIDFIPAVALSNMLLQNGIRACETVCANKKRVSTLSKGVKM
jgi:hypothetical protein